YDGMFVPSMRQHHLVACEAGVSAYQHPARRNETGRFDEQIDDFSALVLLLTLASVDADLWERYHEDGRLLLSDDDLLSPSESPLLNELASRPGAVGALASIVGAAAEQGLDKVPRFGNVISGLGMEWSGPQPPLTSQLIVDAGPPDGRQPAPSRSHTTSPQQAQDPAEVSAAPQQAPATDISPSTDRQRQVAELVWAGKTRAEVASALGLDPVIVDKHIKALQRKTEQEGAAPLKKSPAKSAQPQPQTDAQT